MIRWLRSLFAWRRVSSAGVWGYWENQVTGQRAAVREVSGGYSPIDFHWLENGWAEPWVSPLIDWIPAWRTSEGRLRGNVQAPPPRAPGTPPPPAPSK